MSMSLYSLSKSYTNQWLYTNKNGNSLLNVGSSNSLEDLISKYSYLKKNYKDIKNELKNIGKDDTKSSKDKTTELEKTAKSQAKIIVDTKLSAGDLKDSVTALSDAKLYEADKEGKVDNEKILNAAKDFVKNYNSVKEIAQDSTNDTVVRQAYYMVNTTNANKNQLSKIGITVKSDNTLELDEEAFKKANVSSVKSLFQGSVSYGKQIETRANGIKSAPNGGYITYSNKDNNKSILESYLASIQNTSFIDYFA
ncbi:MAG: hypothetical protein MJ245_03865 [Clostridia bacterium]|nr:hypothetical protein [Clostridia bacterium]